MRMEYKSCKQPEVNYRKGLWSPDEDQKLRDYILMHGLSCWSAVPAKAGELFLHLAHGGHLFMLHLLVPFFLQNYLA